MRWKQKTLILGTVRVVTRFLFFPKCINGVCRWLEYATYKQQYKDGYSSEGYLYYWDDISWED